MHLFSKNKVNRTIVVDSLNYNSKSTVVPVIFQIILLCTTLVGFLYCVATSVDMPIGFGIICAIGIPMMLLAVLLSLNKKVFIVFLSTFGVAILSIIFFAKDLFEKIIDSFVFCYNLTIHIMVEQGYTNYQSSMTVDLTSILLDEQYVVECFYTVIIVLSIIISIIFASTLVKHSLIWISALPCFLFLTPSLYFGSTPSGIAFSIFISGVLGCYIESISRISKNKKMYGKQNKTICY